LQGKSINCIGDRAPSDRHPTSKPPTTPTSYKRFIAMEIKRINENCNEVLKILQTVLEVKGTAEDLDLSPMILNTTFYFDNEKNPCFAIVNHGKFALRAIANGEVHIVQPCRLTYEIDIEFPATITLEITCDL
jgi:hypothetical protein